MTDKEFVEIVRAQVGERYVLGAEVSLSDPDPPGPWDCSELVQWAYAQAGATITDGAWLQYDATEPVPTPRIGDLVFLRNNPSRPNGIGHVGIIVSEGADPLIVEAKGSRYGVVESRLSDWKAKSTYAGVRRYAALRLERVMYFFKIIVTATIPEAVAFAAWCFNTLKVRAVSNGTLVVIHADDAKSKRVEAEAHARGHIDPFWRLPTTKHSYTAVQRADDYRPDAPTDAVRLDDLERGLKAAGEIAGEIADKAAEIQRLANP